jgi:hypothetical protein
MMNTRTANPAPRAAPQSTHRTTAVLVGLLFLTSTMTFAIGSSLIAAFFSGNTPASLEVGVLLQGYTGLAVAGIGLAMLPLLMPYHLHLARAYFVLRVLECVAIIGVGAYMLLTQRQVQHYDLLIYAFTSSGGIVFSYLLYTSSLIPRPLAGLGMIGYVLLLLGIPCALLGLADLNASWGMVFFAPGGLFELILPVLLFVKGFRVSTDPL